MANHISTKDIDNLLRLYKDLIASISLKPSKNKGLWEQCLEQAQKEYRDELNKFESQLSSRKPPQKATQQEEKKIQKAFQHITTANAEKIYREKDTKYVEAIFTKEQKTEELIKEIDHFQYSITDELIEFDRAQGTLLETDWQKIRDIYPVIDITHPNIQFHIEKSIDALEAIKCKVKHQQPAFIQKIKSFFCNFYEITLKAIWGAILEKFN
ncbi:MAG: hypothetical protein JXA96_17500 [Sedimentisphaerales bacterium]|nr:hypothetical protein [Sedimentisphaerales bacterium]